MNRRRFVRHSLLGALASQAGLEAAESSPLSEHRIDAIDFKQVPTLWPRHVGKNARLNHHGFGPSPQVAVLKTNQGAFGWGVLQSRINTASEIQDRLLGKAVAELIHPATGILSEVLRPYDLPLHDLAGSILGQPVWKMMTGRDSPLLTKVYSGMIYFDDLDPEGAPAGIDKVLENCAWDREYGYRQVKVKIGRGHKWMPEEAGLQRDIDIVQSIHESFPKLEILVDGNNGFTAASMKRFLTGIDGVPLFWVEEPFHETVEDWKDLATWMKANGYENTWRADGEAKPDMTVLEELGQDQSVNVRLNDICGHGFSRWRKNLPALAKQGLAASPHAWGSGLKTTYIAHLAAAYGNHVTIEGVTTREEAVDFGENRIVDGKFRPSNQPGFGITLKGV